MATNCVVSERYPRYAVGGRVSSSRSVRQVVSPAADDYRLLPTSDAIGYADGRLLAERTSDLPERYRNRDYFGNPIPVDGTPINCGAVQTVVPVQATGFLKLASGVVVKGHGVGLRADSHYVSSAEFPSQVEIDYAGAGELLCYTNSRIAFNAHVPKIGRTSAWITMPPTSVTEVEINPVMASQVVYADEKNGSDAYDGTSATVQGATVGPKKKLQDAIDAVTADFALVSVAPGTYAEGGMSGTGGLMSRVVIGKGKKYVFVRSSGSAEDTFITGAPDPTTHGLGAGATRCADLVSFAFLQGFTLTGGYSDDSGDDLRSKAAGVYCASTGSDCSVIDCIISNNTARSVAAAYYGRIVRSLVTENHVKGSNYCTLWNSVLVSSIIRRMSTIAYTLRSHSSLYNCTVAGLSSQTVATIIEANCNSYNTIYSECGAIPLNSGYNFKGCALWHSTMSPGPGASYTATTADPIFADETGLDFRPCELSGVLGVGGADLVSGDFYLRVGSDFNGNPLCFRNGQLTPGAVQTPCPGVVVATTLKDGIAVEGGRIGTNAVTEASAITVSATKSDTRPFVGFRVDGELLDHSITSLTLDESYGHKTVEAYYTTSWYVDAEHGNDEADGMTPATARLTFEKAMELPFAEKDTLHAARGRYAAGRMKQPQSSHYWTGDGTVELEARLWIDKNITVVADEGPDVTFIVGESAPADKADAYGLGRGALRCVVNTAYSTLKGFTLTGGRTLGASDVSGNDDDKGGAAYLSTIGGGNGALRNCVITNCTAVTGGAIVNAAAHQCKIVDVTATSGATAGYLSFFYGSYLDHLRGPGTILSFYRAFNSCTLGADCFDFEGRPAVFGNPNAATDKVINSIILSSALSNPNCFYDTVLIEGSGYTPSLLTNCHFVASAAAAGLDADGVPVPGSGSPALGNGNWSTYDESRCGTTDLAGKSRRSNNALDIGAYQSDWRAYYARRIGGRAMTCTEVSPTAQWTEQGLRLGDGDFIDLKLKEEVTASNPVSLLTCAAVTGTGILSVTTEKGTSEYTSADSPISYESEFTSGFANHRFAYAADSVDEGAAFVSRLKANVGMSLIIR